MVTKKDTADAKAFRENQEEALKIMAEKDPAFEEGPTATNERLNDLAEDLTSAEVKASLLLNNPVGSNAAYRDPKAEEKVKAAREKLIEG